MTEEEDRLEEPLQPDSFLGKGLNKFIAILFVLGLHLIIFLKILFLK